MVIEIIRINVASNMRVFILPGMSTFISDHILGVICAKCMNIIETDILSLLDNTR